MNRGVNGRANLRPALRRKQLLALASERRREVERKSQLPGRPRCLRSESERTVAGEES